MSEAENTPVEDVQAEPLSYSQIVEFFEQEGLWLEEQTDIEDYDDCPVCHAVRASLDSLRIAVINVLEQAEAQHEAHADEEGAEETLTRILESDRQWYEIAKAGVLNVFMEAHKPYAILRVHKDIKRPNTKPGMTKFKLNKDARRAQRKRQRAARKRGRG
jgi:PleD family two-component response regulator